jgi:hypothetical protein
MPGTIRLRNAIVNYLSDKEANTTSIYEHLCEKSRHGTTMCQLVNILAKDPRFIKVGSTKKAGAFSGAYQICVWTLINENEA